MPTASTVARVHLNAGTATHCADVLAEHHLVLDAGDVFALLPLAHPEGAPTPLRHLVPVAPRRKGQEGSHDDAELVHSEWVRPADARSVRRRRSGV